MTTPHVDLISPPGLTRNAPYAYVAVATGVTQLIFTAGACPLDGNGVTTPVGDVAGQARVTIQNLTTALAAAGATLTDVVKTTVYVASRHRDDLVTAWRVVSEAFGDHGAPSTLLGVAVLGYPDQLVEVEAVAVLGQSLDRETVATPR